MTQSRTKPYSILHVVKLLKPVPVAARSEAWTWGSSIAGIVGSNPSGGRIFVSWECCVLSCRVLCVGLITSPEESYRLRSVLSMIVKPG